MGQTAEQLWERYESGDDDARTELLNQYLGLVYHVARQISRGLPDSVEINDLVSAGTLGIVVALNNFDRSRGLAFSTYATPRIRGAILDDLRSRDWVPRSLRSKARSIASAVSLLQNHLNRAPTEGEVSSVLGIESSTYARWREDVAGAVLLPLDSPGVPGECEAKSYEEVIPDPHAVMPDSEVSRQESALLLEQAIASLPPRERTVLALYYYEELNQKQIAEVLHLTESRISQIRSGAVARLRALLESADHPQEVPA